MGRDAMIAPRGRLGATVALALSLLGACSHEAPLELQVRWESALAGVTSAEEPPPRFPLHAVGERRAGSALALVRGAQRTLLLVADADARLVRAVDPERHEELHRLPVDGSPAELVVGGDGRAYVSLRDKGAVIALELSSASPPQLRQTAAIAVPAEPTGLAVTPDGDTLLVVSSWAATLSAFTVVGREPLFEASLPREPRGVAVRSDGREALVSHAVGGRSRGGPLTVVSLATGAAAPVAPVVDLRPPAGRGPVRGPTPRAFGQGFAVAAVGQDILAPLVLIEQDPNGDGAYGTGQRVAAHQSAIAHLAGDQLALRLGGRVATPLDPSVDGASPDRRCLLPRAIDGDDRRTFTTCLGTNLVVAHRRAPLSLEDTFDGAVGVPDGPTGVAVDASRGWVHVWSQHQQVLSSIRTSAFVAPRGVVPAVFRPAVQPDRMTRFGGGVSPAPSPLARRGRALFHAAGDRRLSADGRACASCHPDGRDDGFTWSTTTGPRQTPMLAGRLGDEMGPFGWDGDAATVAEHVEATVARLGGTGLAADDLDALLAYLHELPPPPRGARAGAPSRALVARGETLFFSELVGCGSCHREGRGSDGERHDVGSGVLLDTPSLRGVVGTAPYFHDGRFSTLRELLVTTQGHMGWSAPLASDDVAALEAFLTTL